MINNFIGYRFLQIIFISLGLLWLNGQDSSPSLTWMSIYALEDFKNSSWHDIYIFMQNNKLPLPPVILFLELAVYKLFGSSYLVTAILYKIGFIVPYLLLFSLARTSVNRLIVVFFISCLFLYAGIIIHRGNPQGYDVFLPLFLMLFIWFVHKSFKEFNARSVWLFSLGAGLCLSFAELTRPFMIYLLPIYILIVIANYLRFKKGGKKLAIIFLSPVILISGILHFNLYVQHEQLTFSNHAGFNLHRAWSRLVPVPDLEEEPKIEAKSADRGENVNTLSHHHNSLRLQHAIFKHWISHPIQSASFGMSLLNEFINAPISIYEHKPNSIFLQMYRLVYQLLSALILINFIIFIVCIVFYERQRIIAFIHPDNLLILTGSLLIGIFAISEKAEEARFLISTLPFVASISLARLSNENRTEENKNKISFNW